MFTRSQRSSPIVIDMFHEEAVSVSVRNTFLHFEVHSPPSDARRPLRALRAHATCPDLSVPNPTKVHVRSLHKSVDETALSEAMSKFGVVRSATILRNNHTGGSRGCGYVAFASDPDPSVYTTEIVVNYKRVKVQKYVGKSEWRDRTFADDEIREPFGVLN
jgi:hypothetical protein